jgi:hypothetical protein
MTLRQRDVNRRNHLGKSSSAKSALKSAPERRMTAERRKRQDNEARRDQMLDQALGRYDGHVFVSLPNAPAGSKRSPKAIGLTTSSGSGAAPTGLLSPMRML